MNKSSFVVLCCLFLLICPAAWAETLRISPDELKQQLGNRETIAEYVETEEDVTELKKIGITYGQGYHLGKPRPLKDWL